MKRSEINAAPKELEAITAEIVRHLHQQLLPWEELRAGVYSPIAQRDYFQVPIPDISHIHIAPESLENAQHAVHRPGPSSNSFSYRAQWPNSSNSR